MPIPGNLLTTAMAVMPHTDIDRALENAFRIETIWKALDKKGSPMDQILEQGLISPATCCLINEDGEKTVEKAFQLTCSLSKTLREKYKLA